ncbi:YrzI family small protein [Pullulanibacillus sp. KACC 23026]|nr:YrzI family small protein [Pullulanibacillus sp. KACC 23026]WEG12167.1 YrzI family small protein [Pullulanibacillus sp. KACC 23026]
MLKLNLLAFTLMISVRKRELSTEELEHFLRVREIHEQILDRRANFRHFN